MVCSDGRTCRTTCNVSPARAGSRGAGGEHRRALHHETHKRYERRTQRSPADDNLNITRCHLRTSSSEQDALRAIMGTDGPCPEERMSSRMRTVAS